MNFKRVLIPVELLIPAGAVPLSLGEGLASVEPDVVGPERAVFGLAELPGRYGQNRVVQPCPGWEGFLDPW